MALTKQEKTFFKAVSDGDVKRVRTLLKKITDIDFDGDTGHSPLEEAIRNGDLPMTKVLVGAGAYINRLSSSNETPLDIAKRLGETKIATYIESKGGWEESPFYSRYRSSRYGYGDDDDDDYFNTSPTFDDDDEAPAKPKRRAAPKKAKARPATKAAAVQGGDAPVAEEKPKIKFTEENLKDVFNAKSWVGKCEEMQQLWEDVPAKLKKKYDFDAALAEAKRETLRKNAPAQNLKLTPVPPQNPPPQQPPASGK